MAKKFYYSVKYLFQKIFSRELFVASVDFVLHKQKIETFNFHVTQLFEDNRPLKKKNFNKNFQQVPSQVSISAAEIPLSNLNASKYSYTKKFFIAFTDLFSRIYNSTYYPYSYSKNIIGTTNEVLIKTNLLVTKLNNFTDFIQINFGSQLDYIFSEIGIILKQQGSLIGACVSLWGTLDSIIHLLHYSYEIPNRILRFKQISTSFGMVFHSMGMVIFLRAAFLGLYDDRVKFLFIVGCIFNSAGAYAMALNLYLDGHKKPLQIKLFVNLVDSVFFLLQNLIVSCEFSRIPLSVLQRILVRNNLFGLRTISKYSLDSAQETIQKLNALSNGLIDIQSPLIPVSLLTLASGKRIMLSGPGAESLYHGIQTKNPLIQLFLKEK